ncbi:MAG: hypothetical protein JSW10_00510 [Pseudomonadota bacterium]|nr:MAG: hypothetical protein JSW10_00510 [Pseudomonadota bacterium]
MKQVKTAVIWLVVGLALGLWFGVNIGKGKPVFSNPFQASTVQEKLRQTGDDILEKSGDALEKGGQALKESARD